ncbi:MAG TPA: metal-dependent hydrolase [Sphingomicrobium sp.]|nr:metal-dependent hydrolase [Sphingomicrobium sp.]
MDNFTHSLTGWALGQAGLKTKTRKGLAALILGANMPDIDVFFGWAPWDPLAMHRGVTHGILGALVLPPLLAGLLWLLDRWQLRLGRTFSGGLPMRWRWLLALSYIGAVSHPSLDVLTTYSVQLLSPFSTLWFHLDGLFIIDLWLWLLLGGAIFWSKRLEKRGGDWRFSARAALAVGLAYILVNLAISYRAHLAVRQWAGDRPADAIFASPPPIASWRRDLVWREEDCYRRSSFNPLSGMGPVGACEPTNMADPLVREAVRRNPGLQKFLQWSILPHAVVERSACWAEVKMGDARYGRRGSSRLGRQARIRTC